MQLSLEVKKRSKAAKMNRTLFLLASVVISIGLMAMQPLLSSMVISYSFVQASRVFIAAVCVLAVTRALRFADKAHLFWAYLYAFNCMLLLAFLVQTAVKGQPLGFVPTAWGQVPNLIFCSTIVAMSGVFTNRSELKK